ncbi:MAG: restriction endonuclease subunit S [Treponema sp.]|nr:restriction endonuclease subunit S [Treponema sp.]
MTAKDLKNALLQEAVQGKLVPQIASEGNARDLLEEIRKARGESLPLATARKRSAATPSAGSNAAHNACSKSHSELVSESIPEDEIPFDIPENWCWCRLGEIINIKSGDGLTASQMKKGSIPVFGGNGVTGYHNTANIHKETIVIGRVGFYCGSVHVTPKEAWVTDNAFITTYPENQINRNFLVHILRHLNLGQDNNATAQPVVSGKKIYPMLFPLPPIAEQKRIVAAIEKFMPLIEEYGKKETVLNELNAQIGTLTKKAILQEAVQGKLVPQIPSEGNAKDLLEQIEAQKAELIKEGKIKKEKPLPEITEDEIPFDIPENWCWCRLGELGDWRSGSTPSRSNPELYNGNIPWLKTGDLNNGYITEIPEFVSDLALETCSMRLNPVGSVLIAMYGATIGKVGILEIPATTNQACCACICSDGLFNKYLFYFLMSQKTAFEEKAEGGAQPNISREKIVNYLFPLPPLSEQKRIVAAIEQLLPLCERLGK